MRHLLKFARRCGVAFAFPLLVFTAQLNAAVSGEDVYRQRCASCHEQTGQRIPTRETLQQMPAARILRALDFGVMITVAYPMRREEREAVATYLGKPGDDPGPPASAYCSDRKVTIEDSSKFIWNGWSPTSSNARFQGSDAAGLNLSQIGRLKLKWAFGFDGDISAFSQPAVIGKQVFVGSARGMIHALRADTGCLQWVYQAVGPVRAAITVAPIERGHAVLFGDQTGWFYALEAETGRLMWKKRIEDHEAARLTGAAAVNSGTVYVPVASWEESRALNPQYPCCTFRGSIVALRVKDGAPVWKTYMIPQAPKQTGKTKNGTPQMGPSGAGVWASPTIDLKRRRLYIATGDNYSFPSTPTSDAIVALDLATGRILWSKQTSPGDVYNSSCGGGGPKGVNCPDDNGPDHDYGSSAILVAGADGHDVLLAGQKSGVVYAFDPDKQGELLWQTRVGKGGVIGGIQWGMASDGQNVYAAVSDATFTATALARVVDPKVGGGLTALRIEDGRKVWYAAPSSCGDRAFCSPAQSAAVTAIPGAVFSGSVDGHLRAFSSEEGKLLWDFDTVRNYNTVNGVNARGGSLDGPGPVIVNGMLFVNSGYARYGGTPGNVLLAFAVE